MKIESQLLIGSARANPIEPADKETTLVRPAQEVDSAGIISADAIRQYAYQKWELAGKPAGDGIPFWLEAEKELASEREDKWGRGNSQDADRHRGVKHPHSSKL